MSLARWSAAPTPTMVASGSAQNSPKWPIFKAQFFFCSFHKKIIFFFIQFLAKPKNQLMSNFKHNVQTPQILQKFMVPYARERCSHPCYAAHTRKMVTPNIAHLPPGNKKLYFFIFFNPPLYPKNVSF